MGRPPLPLGTYGRIDFHHAGSGRVRARARFRGFDGACRAVTRWAGSETDAQTRLLHALEERARFPEGELAAGTRLSAAAAVWLRDLDTSQLATGTRQLYRAAARIYVLPTLGEVRLGELTVAVIDRALGTVRLQHGAQAARAARRALSSVCRTAVRHGAITFNPVRDTRPIACPRKRVRALTIAEANDLLVRIRNDPVAVRLDLPDFVRFMLGTGLRIGEAAAVRESVLDLDAATVHVNAIVVRVNGVGLQIQPRTKTEGSQRILSLPRPLVAMIRRRLATGHRPGPAGVIFTSPAGMIRDPSNTQTDLRQAMDRIGYPWVTSHVFRKTVASRLDDEGFSIRHIADQLGHTRPSTTLDFYLGRRAVTSADFAGALESLVHPRSE